jgi:hypothetical protein
VSEEKVLFRGKGVPGPYSGNVYSEEEVSFIQRKGCPLFRRRSVLYSEERVSLIQRKKCPLFRGKGVPYPEGNVSLIQKFHCLPTCLSVLIGSKHVHIFFLTMAMSLFPFTNT